MGNWANQKSVPMHMMQRSFKQKCKKPISYLPYLHSKLQWQRTASRNNLRSQTLVWNRTNGTISSISGMEGLCGTWGIDRATESIKIYSLFSTDLALRQLWTRYHLCFISETERFFCLMVSLKLMYIMNITYIMYIMYINVYSLNNQNFYIKCQYRFFFKQVKCK